MDVATSGRMSLHPHSQSTKWIDAEVFMDMDKATGGLALKSSSRKGDKEGPRQNGTRQKVFQTHQGRPHNWPWTHLYHVGGAFWSSCKCFCSLLGSWYNWCFFVCQKGFLCGRRNVSKTAGKSVMDSAKCALFWCTLFIENIHDKPALSFVKKEWESVTLFQFVIICKLPPSFFKPQLIHRVSLLNLHVPGLSTGPFKIENRIVCYSVPMLCYECFNDLLNPKKQ